MRVTESNNFTASTDVVHSGCGCVACDSKGLTLRDGFAGFEAVFELDEFLSADMISVNVDSGNPIAVDSDQTITGSLSGTENFDFVPIEIEAGQTYSFAYRGTEVGGIEDPYLVIFDENNDVLVQDDDGGLGRTSLITFTAATTGTYYLGLTSFFTIDSGDPSLDTGNYTLDIWEQGADEVPDTFADAVAIDIGTTFGHIETSNDIDTYQINLEAGQYYTFNLAGGATSFPVGAGELDTRLFLYDDEGNVVASNDDLSFPGDVSSGLGFFAEESGTYYVDVLAYPGETGGYTLDVGAANLDDLNPLDALRWENADNVQFTDVDGVPTAYVYFGDSDENFNQTGDDGGPMVTIDWNSFEKQQVMLALEEYERILGVNYEITDDVDQATFRLLKTESEEYGAYFYPQDPVYGDEQGVGVFNVLSGAWNFGEQQSLEEGGFAFAVILHEFGHAHGVAHPHDQGGGSDVLLGVTGPTGSYGIYDLNQGVYTVMSYNDAWDLGPNGPTPFSIANIDSGWSGTLGAFDIAILQERYGVTERNTGNDVYELKDVNDQGTFYETIWDSGGTDEILYNGALDAQIDLTAATIDYSPTGGGVVSFLDGIWGGYTIANGVVIENATGGSGDDFIFGNDANNVLKGGAGNDTMLGRGGVDTFNGGAGFDTVSYADADSGIIATQFAGLSGAAQGDRYSGIEQLIGTDFDDMLQASPAGGTLDGGAGNDMLYGGRGADTLIAGAGADTLIGGAGIDTFVFDVADGELNSILGLANGETIDISEIDADISTEANDGFAWIGEDAFTGTAGELRFEQDGGNTVLMGDTDGDGSADLLVDMGSQSVDNVEILFA